MEMNKKEKIFKICLIVFLTLLGVGGMTCFVMSAELAALPRTDPNLPVAEAISQDISNDFLEMASYFNSLQNTSRHNEVKDFKSGEDNAAARNEETQPLELNEINDMSAELSVSPPMDRSEIDLEANMDNDFMFGEDNTAEPDGEIAPPEPNEITDMPAELLALLTKDRSEKDLAPRVDAEPEPGPGSKSSGCNRKVTLAVLNELALTFGRIKRMETAVSGDAENPAVKTATEPEHMTPEVIEISSDQNCFVNYIKMVWSNSENKPHDEKDSPNQ
jgi:hypothetical protein